MDSYDFGRYMGRPASPPLPDGHSGGYLPQMPAYGDTSPSGRSSGVPQSIDFGGSVTGYSSDASQSRHTSVLQPIDFGGSVTGYSSDASHSRHTSVPPIEYGGATGSSASQPTSSERGRPTYTDEEKSRALSGLQQALDNKLSMRKYAAQIGIPQANLSRWRSEALGSLKGNYTSRYTDEEKSRAVRKMLDMKCTPDEYSMESKIPATTLRRWLKGESTGLAQDVGSSRSKHYRQYSDEVKSRAVREMLDMKYTPEEYSRIIKIPAGTLRRWLSKDEGSSKDPH